MGSGVCSNAAGNRVQYCEKVGPTAAECKAKCDESSTCVGYNPNTHSAFYGPDGVCFLFYNGDESAWGGVAWASNGCHSSGNAGPITGHDGMEGGTCYMKIVASTKAGPTSSTVPTTEGPTTTEAPVETTVATTTVASVSAETTVDSVTTAAEQATSAASTLAPTTAEVTAAPTVAATTEVVVVAATTEAATTSLRISTQEPATTEALAATTAAPTEASSETTAAPQNQAQDVNAQAEEESPASEDESAAFRSAVASLLFASIAAWSAL